MSGDPPRTSLMEVDDKLSMLQPEETADEGSGWTESQT